MKPLWAMRLSHQDAACAAVLRGHAGVEVCDLPDALWVRGPVDDRALARAMWLLPGVPYRITAESQLVPWNHLLPIGQAPDGPWTPLAAYVAPTAAAPALPGATSVRVQLRLIRAGSEQPAHLLLLEAPAWLTYVATAPGIRLARLRFALCADGRVLVAGQPLPPLPGIRYTCDHGIAVPCGYSWAPPVPAAVVAELLALEGDQLAVFAPDAMCEVVPAGAWVAATRSAVRISLEGVQP